MSLVIELSNGSRAPSADVCRIRTRRRGEMKSTRRAARSRSAGYRLDYAPGVCGRANYLLRAAADLRGAASVSVLALSTNRADEPWDQVSEGPGGDGLVAAPSQPESREDVGRSNQAALADSA